jgi:hypothetical protein
VNLDHFPTEENLDSSFLALFKSNLIRIGELEDFLVRSPVLNTCILCSTTLKNVLANKMIVVECIEIRAFSFVWELWRIANHVSVSVVPSVVVVAVNTLFVVDGMNEHVALRSVFELFQTFDVL